MGAAENAIPVGVVLKDGVSSILIDERGPIVIATWFGEPTMPLIDRYFEWHYRMLDRVRARGGRYILITDTFATKSPSASARKRIAELTAAQPADVLTLAAGSYIVLESPLIRGAFAALGWLFPRMAETATSPSIAHAIASALRDLDQLGIARPAGLDAQRYRRPLRP